VIGQVVSLIIMFPGNMSNAELQGARQFAACPVEGVKAGAAAGIFARHLLHHQLRV